MTIDNEIKGNNINSNKYNSRSQWHTNINRIINIRIAEEKYIITRDNNGANNNN